ncbi:helix-turn-helix domain-containing protein [Bacteroides acidifaciens]|jgi:transcriptional regulator with XRE-family HTH domain|uniref:helix-turn-helix domain-containing protein n=1 Tax=Bacteroides acidifaciens TaxID=85831 RepID=UPI00259B050A|nr:helix-turn-helix transcriptional regulator [Bacteroides acidifaciens]
MICNLGNKLKSARIQNNLSRKVIAQRIGVSVSMVGLYESNVRQPSLPILIKLAAIYKVSVDYLLGTETNKQNVLYLDGLTSKQIEALKMTAECFRNLNK